MQSGKHEDGTARTRERDARICEYGQAHVCFSIASANCVVAELRRWNGVPAGCGSLPPAYSSQPTSCDVVIGLRNNCCGCSTGRVCFTLSLRSTELEPYSSGALGSAKSAVVGGEGRRRVDVLSREGMGAAGGDVGFGRGRRGRPQTGSSAWRSGHERRRCVRADGVTRTLGVL